MVFDHGMHFGNMDGGIAEDGRHVLVYFDDDAVAFADHCRRIIVVGPEAEMPGSVHRRNSDEKRIHVRVLGQRPRDLRGVARNVARVFPGVGNTLLDNQAIRFADKEITRVDSLEHFGSRKGFPRVFHGVLIIQTQILRVTRENTVGKGARSSRRHAHTQRDEKNAAISNRLDGRRSGGQFLAVLVLRRLR